LILAVLLIFSWNSLTGAEREGGLSEGLFSMENIPGEEQKAESAPDYTSLAQEAESLRRELDSVKNELKKKQDAPDTAGKFSCRLGGMLLADALTVSQSEENRDFYGDVENQYMIRDLRLSMKGSGYGFLEYVCTVGLNRDSVNFKDVFLKVKNLPAVNELKIGHFDVESDMSYLASTCDQTFASYEVNPETFAWGRRLGIASVHYGAEERSRLFLGIFAGPGLDKSGAYSGTDKGLILNIRGTALPIYREGTDESPEEVWHIGSSYVWNKPDGKVALRYRPTGWAYSMPYLMSGSLPLADGSRSLAEAETIWQKGRFAVCSEGFFSFYDGFDPVYGISAQTRWMLTPGAYWKYDKEMGCFGSAAVPENLRFIDYENARFLEGFGAWEADFEWSYTDLNNLAPLAGEDAGVIFGTAHELAAGLSWYWNPQTRFLFNWIHTMPACTGQTKGLLDRPCDTLLTQFKIRF